MSTNAAPIEAMSAAAPPNAAAPPYEGSRTGRKAAVLIGLAILAAAIGLAVFMLRRSGPVQHGSLITSAMEEMKRAAKNEDKDEDKSVEPPAEKKEEKKFPPPMT